MKRVWISGWLFVPTSSLYTSEPAAISLEPPAANSSEPPAAIHRSLRPSFVGTSGRLYFEIFDRRLLEPPAAVCRNIRPRFLGATSPRSSELQAAVSSKSSTAVGRSLRPLFVWAFGLHLSELPAVIHQSIRSQFLLGASSLCSSELQAAVSSKSSTAVHWSLWPPFVGVRPSVRWSLLPSFVGVSGRRSSEPLVGHFYLTQKNFLEMAASLVILLGLSKVFSGSDL